MKVYRHTIGTCAVRDSNGFLMIPKNASTSYTSLGHIDNTGNQTIAWKNFIVTLRDPFTRWLSGVSEFYIRNESQFPQMKDLERAVHKIELDEHTVPQIRFFEHLLDNNQTEFYLLENGLDIVNNKYNLWDKIPLTYKSDNMKKMIQFGLKWYVRAHPELGGKIKSFYEEDYKFIRERFPTYPLEEV